MGDQHDAIVVGPEQHIGDERELIPIARFRVRALTQTESSEVERERLVKAFEPALELGEIAAGLSRLGQEHPARRRARHEDAVHLGSRIEPKLDALRAVVDQRCELRFLAVAFGRHMNRRSRAVLHDERRDAAHIAEVLGRDRLFIDPHRELLFQELEQAHHSHRVQDPPLEQRGRGLETLVVAVQEGLLRCSSEP